MKGTEKQIAWAESIRKEYVKVFDDRIREIADDNSRRMTEERREKKMGEAVGFRDWMLSHEDAKFWIDNRDIDTVQPWFGNRMRVLLATWKQLAQEGRI